MKKLIFIIPLLFTFSLIYGQVHPAATLMSQGNNEALILPLKKTSKKQVEDAWTKFIKNYKGKTKKDKKSGEIFSDNAMIKEVSDNTIDVYAKVIEKNEDTDLVVWFNLGGAYLNPVAHGDQYAAATQMLENFQLTVSTAALEEQIKEQEGLLKKMGNDLDGLKKDQTNAEDDIKKYEKKIEEARKAIEESLAAQKAKENEIDGQKKVIEELSTKLKSIK